MTNSGAPSLNHLPKDIRHWHAVRVQFPVLLDREIAEFKPDQEELLKLLKVLSRDGSSASTDRVRFIGSARVENLMQYLIYSYLDLGHRHCYLVYCRDALSQEIEIQMALANGLNPQQFLLAHWHGLVTWNNYELSEKT